MKKIITLLLTLVLLFSFTFSASAVARGFLVSPSVNDGPIIVEFYNSDGRCTADWGIVPYSKRNNYDARTQQLLNESYATIVNAPDLTYLSDELKKIAEDKEIPAGNLAVVDLFSKYYLGCEEHDHEQHGYTRIKLKPETVKNFVALLNYNDGKWSVVPNVKVEDDCLVYEFTRFSPYAIVIDTKEIAKTGDAGISPVWIIVLAVSAIGLIVLSIVFKKKKI